MDNNRREISDGWVAITDGFVSAIGSGLPPAAKQVVYATDCLVTPGLVNTHHHLYQNLTRAFPPMTNAPLFGWLQTLYPLWRSLDEESANVSAWVGLAELALSGCTTSTDHLYVHPAGAGDLLSAEIAAARSRLAEAEALLARVKGEFMRLTESPRSWLKPIASRTRAVICSTCSGGNASVTIAPLSLVMLRWLTTTAALRRRTVPVAPRVTRTVLSTS